MPRRELQVCHYCKSSIPAGKETKDHVVPRARGGLDIRWNIVFSCQLCNRRKSDSWPTCPCNFCRRSRRRHWQQLGIHEHNYKPKS